MKGDISADFHVAEKRFTGARAQAGRVLTEADFNAAFDAVDDALESLVRTLVCAAGSPDGGLEVTGAAPVTLLAPDGTAVDTYEVTVAPGTFVLGGRANLLDGAIASLSQTEWLSQILDVGQLPPAPQPGRTDLVWVEQSIGAVHAVEDRELQERALPADTTTRLRPQIRIRILDDVPGECHLAAHTLNETLRQGGHGIADDRTEILSAARLGVTFTEDGANQDPCAPAAAAGYLGAENHTLRVMLTAPDRFVWAYDHGTPLYRVQIDAANGEVVLLTEPRDPMLYPLPGQIIEILPWDILLPNREKVAARLGHLAELTGTYDPPNRRIAYDGSMPADWQTWLNGLPADLLGEDDTPSRFFYARIWQPPVSGAGPDQQTGTDIVLPETGVALHFAGTGIAGDYWTVALRPDAPESVHPWNLLIDPAAGELPEAPPIGPRRFHAPLALVTWPDPLGSDPEIHDCRNRFRRLCQIKSCCTFQVGDGQTSFGDFNTIQAAVDALPAEGGQICLLPGTHRGRIDLRGLSDIRITGCGMRSHVVIETEADHPGRPGVWLDGSQRISFCDFRITGAGGPVFGAAGRVRELSWSRLTMTAEDSAAVVLLHADVAGITECRITAATLSQALTAADLAALLPLIFMAGTDLRIERNHIVAERGRILSEVGRLSAGVARNRVALGGIQIGGRSRRVRIEDNHIEGGNGHGITLGSLIPGRRQPGDDIIIRIPPWLTIDEDGCVKVNPGGTIRLPEDDVFGPPRSAGPVMGLRIRDNDILDHGGCGISVAHWFLPNPAAEIDELDDIEIAEAEIDDNRIHRCMLIDWAQALPLDAAFNSGYGGIALSSVSDLVIDDNEIRACGGGGRSPICGIYLRYAERIRITRNRISENGRLASLRDPLLVGNIGGIVIGHADGVEEGAIGSRVREVPAVVVSGNHVISPEGRALEITGTGAMMVHENSLTAHGNNLGGVLLMLLLQLLDTNASVGGRLTASTADVEEQYRAAVSQIGGSAVWIVNTGINRNLALLAASGGAFLNRKTHGGMRATESGGEWHSVSHIGGQGMIAPAANRNQPGGQVAFNDNMVTFDAQSDAFTLSLCSIAILSLDDVGMHDNHAALDLGRDMVLINALAIGLFSCRVQGNRFRETLRPLRTRINQPLPPTIFSAVTLGLLNATEQNQGDFCFLAIGAKKPRIRMITENDVERPVLDTNRHTLPDGFCAPFFAASSAFGTD